MAGIEASRLISKCIFSTYWKIIENACQTLIEAPTWTKIYFRRKYIFQIPNQSKMLGRYGWGASSWAIEPFCGSLPIFVATFQSSNLSSLPTEKKRKTRASKKNVNNNIENHLQFLSWNRQNLFTGTIPIIRSLHGPHRNQEEASQKLEIISSDQPLNELGVPKCWPYRKQDYLRRI